MTFDHFVAQDDAKLALTLNAVDPRCGGVLFVGEKGCGKSTLIRLFKNILPETTPFIDLPLHATEDALLGGIDFEDAVRNGRRIHRRGILEEATGGLIYIDDVNLLSPEATAIILKAQSHWAMAANGGRAGLGNAMGFAFLASMNPEEGHLSPHLLDRFGFCIVWTGLRMPAQRIKVMKTVLQAGDGLRGNADAELRERILAARRILSHVRVSPEIQEAIARVCIENGVAGHRADVFLYYAARAYAAFCNDRETTQEHLEKILPFILLHRRRDRHQFPEDRLRQENQQEERPDRKNDSQKNAVNPDASSSPRDETGDNPNRRSENTDRDYSRSTVQQEETFDVGQAFKVRRLVFQKDRINRTASGRRTKTGSIGKRGHHVKTALRPNGDISLSATIRTAAPLQIMRGRTGRMLVCPEDFRYKKREKKMGHLAILVVDGSGSMGAQKRMVETKGAVQSLLLDCYQKRDRIALIVFRKDRAEVVLPPTSSMEMAARRLREIPVGGKTPLAAGLLSAYRIVTQVRMKARDTRFMVILATDGRANQSLSGMPIREELAGLTGILKELPSTDYVVIDTENKHALIRTDYAPDIAASLGADYYRIDDLKADDLTQIVRSAKGGG